MKMVRLGTRGLRSNITIEHAHDFPNRRKQDRRGRPIGYRDGSYTESYKRKTTPDTAQIWRSSCCDQERIYGNGLPASGIDREPKRLTCENCGEITEHIFVRVKNG